MIEYIQVKLLIILNLRYIKNIYQILNLHFWLDRKFIFFLIKNLSHQMKIYTLFWKKRVFIGTIFL